MGCGDLCRRSTLTGRKGKPPRTYKKGKEGRKEKKHETKWTRPSHTLRESFLFCVITHRMNKYLSQACP